jgi:antitoxin component YwqK of YwqJK toxin-antitoxin module
MHRRQAGRRAAALMEWLKHLVIKKCTIGVLVNGWKQGTSYLKFQSGVLYSELNYLNDKQHGIQTGWYYDGVLQFEKNYVNGKLCGSDRIWDAYGHIGYNSINEYDE